MANSVKPMTAIVGFARLPFGSYVVIEPLPPRLATYVLPAPSTTTAPGDDLQPTSSKASDAKNLHRTRNAVCSSDMPSPIADAPVQQWDFSHGAMGIRYKSGVVGLADDCAFVGNIIDRPRLRTQAKLLSIILKTHLPGSLKYIFIIADDTTGSVDGVSDPTSACFRFPRDHCVADANRCLAQRLRIGRRWPTTTTMFAYSPVAIPSPWREQPTRIITVDESGPYPRAAEYPLMPVGHRAPDLQSVDSTQPAEHLHRLLRIGRFRNRLPPFPRRRSGRQSRRSR